MKLPSGKMCSVAKLPDGTWITSMYPSQTAEGARDILREWVSVNPNHEAAESIKHGMSKDAIKERH